MISETEFIEKYELEKPILKMWGQFVKDTIDAELIAIYGSTEAFTNKVKISTSPRVKANQSILAKAFYRKHYRNPYTEITDKVGIRYVYLLESEIADVEKIIQTLDNQWRWFHDRDFYKEREKYPLVFDYQSSQFIVRNIKKFEYNGFEIPKNTPCEIQIRTLLQHAYAELSHDTVYKPRLTSNINSSILRLFSRSMAHIETTDCLFLEVVKEMEKIQGKKNQFIVELSKLFSTKVLNQVPDLELNLSFVESYWNEDQLAAIPAIMDFFESNENLYDLIKRKIAKNLIYSQPVILLIFYMLFNQKAFLIHHWPYSQDYLSEISISAGVNID